MHRPAMFSTADAALKSVPGSERIVGYIPLPIHTMSSNEPSFLCQSGNENRLPAFSRLFYSQSNVESVSSRMLTGLFGVDKNKCSITAPSIHACPKNARALHPHPAIKVPMMGLRSFPSFCVDVVLVEIQKVGKKTENPVYFLNR